ncbi:DUF2169 domain-containing protein [Chitinispirillales bacterium ANBcel5]|uniref:DUF2169 family type VI secretion system accessory protein n=1 Tax=Cellulosispirillum alkaliphilum TaxID=3039283 RepID=UPI002A4EE11F|nr:DUF2169 domain-containing protein [Chitinispirillales bacterium ANBcel5]
MWQTRSVQGSGPSAKPILSVLAKKTYSIEHNTVAQVSEDQIEMVDTDTFEDPQNPSYSEVLAESDLQAFKPSTDFIVIGNAHAPGSKQAYHLDCQIIAGPYNKTIRVFGDRKLQYRPLRGLSFSDPEPFSEIALGYKNAYGGVTCSKDGTPFVFYPNPIGNGFTLKGALEDASELKVPNQENPEYPLVADDMILGKFSQWKELPLPASLGWTRRNFYPRYTFCGVFPEHLEGAMENLENMKKKNPQMRSMKIPSMDFRFYQGASEGLWGKRLVGNEQIQLKNLDPKFPLFKTALPGETPCISLDVGNGAKELKPYLDTVVVDKPKNLVTLLWRGTETFECLEDLMEIETLKYTAQ